MSVERISPQEVHKRLESGNILLVCAYEDESRFKQIQLGGAIVPCAPYGCLNTPPVYKNDRKTPGPDDGPADR